MKDRLPRNMPSIMLKHANCAIRESTAGFRRAEYIRRRRRQISIQASHMSLSTARITSIIYYIVGSLIAVR